MGKAIERSNGIMYNYPLYAELPYSQDSASLFEAVRDEPWPVFLDSSWPLSPHGRFDIIAADPFVTLSCRGQETTVWKRHHCTFTSFENPFTLLQAELHGYRPQETVPLASEVPLTGGAIGYFSYDLGRRLEKLPTLALDAEDLPEMAVGFYDWVAIVDHCQQRCLLVSQGHDSRTQERWEILKSRLSQANRDIHLAPFHISGPLESNMDPQTYQRTFHRIQQYIRQGDCYQVNLAQRFSVPVQGDPWALYRRLRAANAAPFSAYFATPTGIVLSASPERFLLLRGDKAETRPIKGTRPRAADPTVDRLLALELQQSTKDRAENVMIVDLLRNDLGRVCKPGSIHVPRLWAIESFTTVHHLVSTVCGQLAPGHDALDLLRACFPGGSVTGAPKIRAMEIIEELEPHRRGIYCGSLGYIGFNGNMDLNIAIRTLIYNQGYLRFWAGGGIVADSTEAAEYQETLDKAAAILGILEEFGASTLHFLRSFYVDS
jgi:para-aminobenzoate synthetase component I